MGVPWNSLGPFWALLVRLESLLLHVGAVLAVSGVSWGRPLALSVRLEPFRGDNLDLLKALLWPSLSGLACYRLRSCSLSPVLLVTVSGLASYLPQSCLLPSSGLSFYRLWSCFLPYPVFLVTVSG